MSKFTVINRKTGSQASLEINKDSMTIGRHHNCDIVLDSKTVSRKHAEIVRKKNNYFLVDLESGNGTLLNSERLKPHEKRLLNSGDLIRVEEFEIRAQLPEKPADAFPEENTDSGIIEIKMIKKVLSALDTDQFPSLNGLTEPAEGKKVTFTDDIQELVIGRDADCLFSINSSVVSRRHAVLHKKWGGITITDLKSKNGTFVNNQRVDEKLLKDGDMIMLGNIKLVYRNPHEIDMEALSREYEKKEREIKRGAEKEAARERAKISEEARLSVEPGGEEKEKREEIKAPAVMAGGLTHFLSRFSITELVFMAAGIVVLIVTLIALLIIIS